MSTRRKGFFIAGTDTGVGKSLVAVGLVRALAARGLRVVGMKPVAAGAETTAKGLRNEDALALQAASTVEVDYELVNPYCLPEPVSPHIAAQEAGVTFEWSRITHSFEQLSQRADCVVVEGAGGWLVPINETATMADIAQQLSLPVIMVVGLRLGCLNHALLTASAIRDSGLELAAWVGNHMDPRFARPAENLMTLERRLGLPPVAVIPYSEDQAELETQARRGLAALAASA